MNYNSDTNFNPCVAIEFDNVNLNTPVTDNIVVSWTTAIELPNQILTNLNGTVYVRGFGFNPQQKQGPATLAWNQFALTANGGNSTISMDGQCNFVVAWQQNTDPDVSAQTSEGIYAAEYQLENYTAKAAAGTGRPGGHAPDVPCQQQPARPRLPRPSGPSTRKGAEQQMDIDGDIVTSYQGNGQQVSNNISIPASFFTSDFTLQQQQLTFNFTAGIPVFNATNNQFMLQVGSVTTGAITFSSGAATTARNIQTAPLVKGGLYRIDRDGKPLGQHLHLQGDVRHRSGGTEHPVRGRLALHGLIFQFRERTGQDPKS